MRSPRLYLQSLRPLLLVTLVLGALLLPGCQEAPGPAPVIVISLDTLRPDHLSVYGYERPTSPYLEELAREAVVFERAYQTGGGTLPSHTSLFTGLTPLTHGVKAKHDADNVLHLARGTLAEQFRDAGYWTAAFTDRGWLRSRFGIHQGFDVFDESGGRFATILPKVRRWLDRYHDLPFFLFVHSYDIHSQSHELPYDCPAPYLNTFTGGMDVEFDGCRGGLCASKLLLDLDRRLVQGELEPADAFTPEELEYVVALYDGCIRYADQQVAELMEYLKTLGLYDESLVVVLSDHGEEFLDHGRLVHQQGGYDELTRMPLLIKFPGGEFGGRRSAELATMVDVLPTVLDAVGVEIPPEVQGKSLMPWISRADGGEVEGGDDAGELRQAHHIYNALTTKRWKMLRPQKELYDLENDPEETANLWNERQDVVQRLLPKLETRLRRDREALVAFEESLAVRKESVGLTAGEIDELQALGYLDGVE